MKTIEINLYSFDELSKDAKFKAISEHISFEISEIGMREDDEELNPYYPLAMEMERMQTPWFLAETIYHTPKYRQMIIDTIKANEYTFEADGTMNNG